ncbi:MAG TPA: hypothetical protein PKO15_12145 [Fibrobacteria bacterium]|nr:hypothetical protein [Fibrobacteria bacterium]HOX51345.1 hypothetical protein [Fibrobacteria bacterium]
MSPNQKTPNGLGSWDLLWVDPELEGEAQLRSFLLEDQPPKEILITGGCGALEPHFPCGLALYANEILDPRLGPHWPQPTRALSLKAVQKALGADAKSGKFLTTEVPCVTPSHKHESGHGYGAIAVDQDSAVLCRPCKELDIGHAVVRFVLDPMEVDLSSGAPGRDAAFFHGARECEMGIYSLISRL